MKLKTLLTLAIASICSWQGAWAQEETELSVTVSLLEPGSLGSEILAAPGVDHIKNVVNLTVSGQMNDDDWETLKLLEKLKRLDMENAQIESLPDNQFYQSNDELVSVILPGNLKTIGKYAFEKKANLVSIQIPNTVESIGWGCFYECRKLETANWPSSATIIPEGCFYNCSNLQPFTIPEGVVSIGNHSFYYCRQFTSTIPSTIKYIGYGAFDSALMQDVEVVIPEGTTTGHYIFRGTKIKSISLPSTFYTSEDSYGLTMYCDNLTDITLKSPTVVKYEYSWFSTTGGSTTTLHENITLHVPAYLINSYKSNAGWGKCANAVAADVSDVTNWAIQTDFTMSNSIRMTGMPNVTLSNDITLNITGDNTQTFGDFTLNGHSSYSSWNDNYHREDWTQILSTCDNVSVTGNYSQRIGTYEKQWYFISLPFDVQVSDITTDNSAKYAIRYYDGANRAANNTASGNWKNYDSDDVIPAGTGFIYQTSATTVTTFKAVNNDSRNNVFKNVEFVKTLARNNTTNEGNTLEAANKGWNLVGNPWQTYYNIHKLNYTAPISVYERGTYTAYSLQDDDYALEPNQAFFVQCPDAANSIGFPTDGRQLTSEITEQNAVRSNVAAEKSRWLIDLQIENGDGKTDKTRLVVNNTARMDYEIERDASKFMSLDGTVPQIYSLGTDGTEYAINERPMAEGTQRLGLLIKEAGQHTIKTVRNDIGQVLLTDNMMGITTHLSQNGYCFDAEAGTDESRFTLQFVSNEVTGIAETVKTNDGEDEKCYNLNGQRVNVGTGPVPVRHKGLYIVGGKKVVVK